MEFVKVSIIDKDKLKLEQDAKKGDIIDLKSLMHVDLSNIEELIKNNKDQVYIAREKQFEDRLKEQNKHEIFELTTRYERKLKELEKCI